MITPPTPTPTPTQSTTLTTSDLKSNIKFTVNNKENISVNYGNNTYFITLPPKCNWKDVDDIESFLNTHDVEGNQITDGGQASALKTHLVGMIFFLEKTGGDTITRKADGEYEAPSLEKMTIKRDFIDTLNDKDAELKNCVNTIYASVIKNRKAEGEGSITIKAMDPSDPLAPTGLPNIGNSCYMNAALQLLFAAESLLTPVLENIIKEANKNTDKHQIAELLQKINNNKNYDEKEEALKELRKIIFNDRSGDFCASKITEQQDASAFLGKILGILDIKKITTSVTDADLFQDEKNITHLKFEEETEKNIDLEKKITDHFNNNGDDLFDNNCKIKLENNKPPEYLFFDFPLCTAGKKETEKTPTQVTLPSGPIKLRDIFHNPDENDSYEYEVIGIVQHNGELASSGHYTSLIHKKDDHLDQWYNCNDNQSEKTTLPNPISNPKIFLLKRVKKQPVTIAQMHNTTNTEKKNMDNNETENNIDNK